MGAPPLSQKPGNMRSRGDRYEPSFRRCPRWSIGLGWLGILVAFGAVLPRIVWTFDDFWSAMQVPCRHRHLRRRHVSYALRAAPAR